MSTEQQNPSSSSNRCTYDAFLSFRGADTRKGFTDHLYNALKLAGIHTFRDDDEIERGENIAQELQTAIQESQVSIIVFSKDYASSRWCLNELAIIMERKRTDGHMVIPVFYYVEPSDVRKQTGSFAESFTRHQEQFKDEIDKVEEWRRALRDVADLGGMVLKDRYEWQFIQEIVEVIGNELDYMTNRRLRVDPHVIGRGYYVESLNMWLEDGSNDVGVAVIHGMGGIGKTTIAKIAYNQNFNKFQASSFLSDIRETSKQANGFVHLQMKLLSDIQRGKMEKIYSLDEGIVKIKRVVRCKRVLIVLDDVENSEQFNAIIGMRDWFHPGCKIIITTRHEHLLKAHEVVRFKVEGLHEYESLKLFSWHAFGQPRPQEGYMELSRPIVEHCGGVPLALKVLGSSLFGKTADIWENALHNLDEFTEGKIRKILCISFDSLQDHDKRLFLHIACFFVGKNKDFTTTILDECDFATKVGLQCLVDRCLVKINVYNKLTMHQLLQDMGRAIIREESPEDPGKRTRLWHKDAINVLRKLTGTRSIKGLMLNFPSTDSSPVLNEEGIETKAFTEMLNLELLLLDNVKLSGSYEDFPKNLIWLSWRGFSLKSIPANFCLENLVVLDLRKSSLQHVWKRTRFLTRLKILNLSHSHGLRTTSDLSGLPNLEKLILKDCINLIDVDESIGNLGKLVFLNLKDCKSLTKLPKIMNMLRSLEELNLSGCSKLLLHDSATVIHLHAISRDMNRPRLLSTLSWTPIRSWWMWAWPGKTLQSTSFSLASLPRCLGSLNLSDCNLSEVPNDLCTLSSLKKLDLTDNPILCLPQNMKSLIMLETLLLKNCTNLEMLPELPARLETLVAFGCESLKRLTNLPNLFKSLDLNFGGCPQLVEVESLLNIKTLISLFNMESIASTDDEMLNNLTDTTRKVPVQVFFDFRTYSIFLHASKIPDGFDFTSKIPDGFDFTTHKPVLSFIPPLHPNHKSLNVAVLYAKNEHQIKASGLNMIHVQVIHEKGGSTGWTHSLRTVGLPTENGDVLWLCHIQFESKERECVRVSVEMSDFYRVKELGIQLLYAQNNVVAGQVSLSASPYGHRMGPLSYYGRLPRTCFIEKVDS
ncbi:disease resistance protein RPV1-like isoform X1 [Malus sylvestris]|uniref:disease resistance protein RPV1-like isoform X1 n=1 Tax=Malus sylvestris TaxID=3752 RepID=UPI0021AC3B8B|nr:disease resistance protein RPV1-like isoform X1 [Malus sylvestris]XP_050126427.1 disease resistance protein RPV1-like isoform X1 [Malus sylvestris]